MTFADIELAMRDIPAPPKMRARPEYVQYLMSKLPAFDPGDPAAWLDIVEDPHLHCTWVVQYHDKTIFEDLDGMVWSLDHPKFERFDLPPMTVEPPPRVPRYYYSLRSRPEMCPRAHFIISVDYGTSAPRRRRRPSRGMRKHIRRMKAEKRRETR